ncbi:MAG: M67 family metallopeptidase [Gammaproteobacteria bacterium]|jgi:proteasome lid subunit RPN8/RPN11|nr:M67 family metallopeptidase [Gammaproteobacteria bacterium]
MSLNEPAREPGQARLPRPLANAILDHVRETPEHEVCGLVIAADGLPQRCLRLGNLAPDPRDRYVMDPPALIRALYEIEQAGETLFAIYHSHPLGQAVPSAIDIADAAYPDAIYLIVTLGMRGVMEMRAWRIRDGRALEMDLEIA